MLIRNIDPLGQLDLPLVGRQGDNGGLYGSGCLEPGEDFEVSRAHALLLLARPGSFEPVDDEARAVLAELAEPEPEPEPVGDASPTPAGATRPPAEHDGSGRPARREQTRNGGTR